MRTARLHGPPGTGKTSRLAGSTYATVTERGPDAIRIASFSQTAAREIASREGVRGVLPAHAVGTLHGHAYRAIGHPPVALDPKVITDWNDQVGVDWAITGDSRRGGLSSADKALGGGRGSEEAENGDQLITALDLLRARQAPGRQWPIRVQEFARKWTEWKLKNGVVDYCLDDRTEVFTARGWLGGEEVREGDLVRSINLETGLAEWQPVESVYRRCGQARMIHMSNAVHDSVTTPDHRWPVNRRNGREEWSRQWSTTAELNSTCRILRGAVSGDAPTEPKYTDALVEMVAWWFTEGSLNGAGRYRGGQIGQSHRVNPAYCARIEAALRALAGPPGLRRGGTAQWSISRSEKRGMTFYCLGGDVVDVLDSVAPDKVPAIEFLAQLTPAQLHLFVDTALAADGHVRAQASVLAQNDRRRTEAFAAAATLAGLSVTFAATRTMSGKPSYGVTVSARRLHAVIPGTTGGHAKGTRTSVDYDGLIWCPTVARHHNFLARRNGKTYYTGNSDMIIEAYRLAATGVPLEGAPSVLIVDEAQDMTPIECALTLAWGKLLGPDGRLVFAMDDDQAIMDFRGGDPAKILSADATDEVLSISHRVPSAVHAVAKTWIEQCSHRFPKDYLPRLATDLDSTPAHTRGWAYRAGYGLGSFPLIDAVESDLADGSTVMILATCGYMLTSTLRELRTRGVPFHNPYRPGDPLWNPLGKPARGMSTADRVLSYLIADERALGDRARLWTAADIQAWAELISFTDACMSRGADRAIKALSTGRVPFESVAALFRSDHDGRESLKKATEPDLKWFASVIAQSKQKSVSYPLRVAQSYGAVALLEPPRLVVGTLHSAKGAEASVVYLSPDLSPAGMHQWQGAPVFRDQIRRLFYVGLTRAYHRVVVLAPNSTNAVNPSELIPPSLEARR